VDLKDIKKLELAEIDQPFLEGLGFANEGELREALREQMLQRVEYDVQQSMRDQINNYLLQNVYIDLPSKLSDRQADRVLQRRRIDMLMRGLPEDQVDAQIESLRPGSRTKRSATSSCFSSCRRSPLILTSMWTRRN
jgi:FKBP-type peptidyl-prolyl cis-trans isomerase (trigger factor)